MTVPIALPPEPPEPAEPEPIADHRPPESRIHPERHLPYMEQDCRLTVREALAEYYRQIDDLITEDNAAPEVAALFRKHDLVHVVFGCDTSLRGEAMADTWALAGSDVRVREYMRYLKLQETQQLFAALATRAALWQTLLALPLMVKVLFRAFRMKAKWPFTDHARYLDRPLCEVRDDLGIFVVA